MRAKKWTREEGPFLNFAGLVCQDPAICFSIEKGSKNGPCQVQKRTLLTGPGLSPHDLPTGKPSRLPIQIQTHEEKAPKCRQPRPHAQKKYGDGVTCLSVVFLQAVPRRYNTFLEKTRAGCWQATDKEKSYHILATVHGQRHSYLWNMCPLLVTCPGASSSFG